MLFVIGESYQGKLDYVKNRFGIDDSEIFSCEKDGEIDLEKRCIYHFENYVFHAMKNGNSLPELYTADRIVIMDDINCGAIPDDPEIRAWREAAGKAGSELSRSADEVVKVYCGIAETIKTKTTKIYLIRHGKTQADIDHLYCGLTDIHLSEEGKSELESKKNLLEYPDAASLSCFTSSRQRTQESFRAIFGENKYSALPEFDEMDYGDFEMRKYDGDLQSDPDFIIWTGGNNESNVCPHGESSLIMKRRVLAKFSELLQKKDDTLIVSHSGPIIAIFQEYVPDCGLNYYEIQPKCGEGFCLEFDGSRLLKWSRIAE